MLRLPQFYAQETKEQDLGSSLSTTLKQALPDVRSQEMCRSYGLYLICCLELKHH